MNDSKRHKDDLISLLWRQSKRKDLYHILLLEVVERTKRNRQRYGEGCPFCSDPRWYDDMHADDCLIAVIQRALEADTETVAAMIKDRYEKMKEG